MTYASCGMFVTMLSLMCFMAPKVKAKTKANSQAVEPKAVRRTGKGPKVKSEHMSPADMKKAQSNYVTQMKAKEKHPETMSEGEAKAWSDYKALPRFSDTKARLVDMWLRDKKLTKYSTSSASSQVSEEKDQDHVLHGYGTQWQIARSLDMDVHSPDFQAILTSLPCDHDWNEENPIERVFKQQAFKRYHLEGLKGMSLTTTSNAMKHEIAERSNDHDMARGSLMDKPEAEIEIANPKFLALGDHIKVLQSCLSVLF